MLETLLIKTAEWLNAPWTRTERVRTPLPLDQHAETAAIPVTQA